MGLPSFFKLNEIKCRCGCGRCIVKPRFYFKMNLLRALVKRPLHPTSWNRCEKHNRNEGGSDTSSHLKGWACDLVSTDRAFSERVFYFAGKIGFRGVGGSADFVHLDDDPAKPIDRVWNY